MKEGDNVTFATEDESERTLWVQAIYRATGQTHKPVPPVVQTNKISNTQISRMQGGKNQFTDVVKYMHIDLFIFVYKLCVLHKYI